MSATSNKDSLNLLLARTVKQLRLEKKLSQEELATLASVDRTYISGIERARRNITISTLERLIPHLAASSSKFFESLCQQIENSERQVSQGEIVSIPFVVSSETKVAQASRQAGQA